MITLTYKKLIHFSDKPQTPKVIGSYWNYREHKELDDNITLDTCLIISRSKEIDYCWIWLKSASNPLTQLKKWEQEEK